MKTQFFEVRELRRKYHYQPDKSQPSLTTDSVAGQIGIQYFKKHDDGREHLLVFHLDSSLRIKSYEEISVGSMAKAMVSIAEVFRSALLAGVNRFMIMHNHPNDDLGFSHADESVTRSIVKAGKLLEIECVDHILITSNQYISLCAQKRSIFNL